MTVDVFPPLVLDSSVPLALVELEPPLFSGGIFPFGGGGGLLFSPPFGGDGALPVLEEGEDVGDVSGIAAGGAGGEL